MKRIADTIDKIITQESFGILPKAMRGVNGFLALGGLYVGFLNAKHGGSDVAPIVTGVEGAALAGASWATMLAGRNVCNTLLEERGAPVEPESEVLADDSKWRHFFNPAHGAGAILCSTLGSYFVESGYVTQDSTAKVIGLAACTAAVYGLYRGNAGLEELVTVYEQQSTELESRTALAVPQTETE